MMLKITQRCTMGCTHCMNDAKPDGTDMSLKVFMDSLDFLKKHGLGKSFVIAGGEPTEHPEFHDFMKYLIDYNNRHECFYMVIVATNGEQIVNDPERFMGYVSDAHFELHFQVSTDKRYYPRRVPEHKRIWREKGFRYCDDCVDQIYPMGRAATNNIPYEAKASKCFNVRAVSHQVRLLLLKELETYMMSRGYLCTPHISVDGHIKLGESDLCPDCSSIYKTNEEIIRDIQEFKCSRCDFINDNLPEKFKELL